MVKKTFTYRGKTLEELQSLSLAELSKMLGSAARRKMTRGFTDAEKAFLTKISEKDTVKTHCRDMFILPSMVGKLVKVAKGNAYEDLRIVPEMIGHRLGEFAQSRKRVNHGAMGLGASRSTAHADRK